MSGTTNFEFNHQSYIKVILHAHKYSTKPICGVLLGRIDDKQAYILDSIPLFHGFEQMLAPNFEIAMLQIEQYFLDLEYMILGVYYASDKVNDKSMNGMIETVCNALNKKSEGKSEIFMIDNSKISVAANSNALEIYQTQNKINKTGANRISLPDNIFEKLVEEIGKHTDKNLVDFENHLNDCSLDWTNKDLLI